jgi:glycosyltransferase involved in cell wall biosynthesis
MIAAILTPSTSVDLSPGDPAPAAGRGAGKPGDVPTVSVLMAVYNAAPFLASALQSILEQTLKDFELIALNDGSTDNSAAILEEFARRDPRVRVVSWPNHGITATRVQLLAMARAPFLAIMDADDISLPFRLEKQVEYLQQHPDCVAVGSRVLMIDTDGLPLRTWSLEETHEQIETAYLQRRGSAIVHPSVLMRTGAVRAAGGYDVRFQTCEDQDLFLRLAERGRLANLPETHFLYRQHVDSTCHTKVRQLWADSEAILKEAYARRGLGPIADATPEHLDEAPVEFHRRWAWWALREGNRAAARKHAMIGLKSRPFSPDSWKLALCALRGR